MEGCDQARRCFQETPPDLRIVTADTDATFLDQKAIFGTTAWWYVRRILLSRLR
jgi:hypothetical protein